MSTLAMYLAGARACLQMNIKSVARALRASDRVVTQLEQIADYEDSRVKRLVLIYEDVGLEFRRESDKGDAKIVGVVLNDIKKLVLTADHQANPDQLIGELLTRMRHIAGLIYNLKIIDKSKASFHDTIEIHFPVPVRGIARNILCEMARDILCESNDTESLFKIVLPDGSKIAMNKSNLDNFFEL